MTDAEASAWGAQVGRCFNCISIGRPGHLSDDRSLAVGYGERCAEIHGWWYPTAEQAHDILRGGATPGLPRARPLTRANGWGRASAPTRPLRSPPHP